jgi:stearoyl-CoA desaturase (delta-9 desaturase)
MNLSLVPDLVRNKLIQWQHKYYVALVILTNGLAFLTVGLITKDFLGAFILAWWARLLVSHHFTWFINSVAHTWGTKPYNKKVSAVDNPIMAILTFGEGYHNYHHSFSNDYRNGVKWYHFDPTKWFILLLHTFGLVNNLRKVNKYIIKKKKMLRDKGVLLEKLNEIVAVKKENLEIMIHDLSERISTNITEIRKVRTEKKQQKNIDKGKLKVLRKSLRRDFISWKKLVKMVTSLS